jgi:hypothetical protein
MPDDCGELEEELLKRFEEHARKMETDPEYRKKWESQPNEMLRPAAGAFS